MNRKHNFKSLARYLDIANQVNKKKRSPKSSRVGKIQNIKIMKKITLLVASIFLFGGIVANAADRNHKKYPVDFRNVDPIVFTERGVEFYIFADGQFDFNTRPSVNEVNYNSGRRSLVNKTYGVPVNHKNSNYGVKVENDKFGRIKSIGNVRISYDANNRVKRVGSVYMNYNRYALSQVGGLQIIYNRQGLIVDFVGNVNGGVAYQYNQKYDDDNDYRRSENTNNNKDIYYNTKNTKPTKVVANIDIRIKR
jgi:hypothetical protein